VTPAVRAAATPAGASSNMAQRRGYLQALRGEEVGMRTSSVFGRSTSCP
jgi:hypothetical protein